MRFIEVGVKNGVVFIDFLLQTELHKAGVDDNGLACKIEKNAFYEKGEYIKKRSHTLKSLKFTINIHDRVQEKFQGAIVCG